MECESMLFVKNHIPYLWDLSNSFSNSFVDFYSCEGFHQVIYQKKRSIKLRIDNGGWRETLNFLHDAKCYILWCLTWNKTKVANKLESAQYGLEISFKQQLLTNILPITVSFVVNNWVWQSRSTCFQNPCAWRWSGLTVQLYIHVPCTHTYLYMISLWYMH